MPGKSTEADSITDEHLDPAAAATARQAQRLVASCAKDADECRLLLSMLDIRP